MKELKSCPFCGGSGFCMENDNRINEPHEVAGYKKIKDNYYLLFNDGVMVVVERAI